MACEFICDGCGKREPAELSRNTFQYHRPSDWSVHTDLGGTPPQGDRIPPDKHIDACSSACLTKARKIRRQARVVSAIIAAGANK